MSVQQGNLGLLMRLLSRDANGINMCDEVYSKLMLSSILLQLKMSVFMYKTTLLCVVPELQQAVEKIGVGRNKCLAFTP